MSKSDDDEDSTYRQLLLQREVAKKEQQKIDDLLLKIKNKSNNKQKENNNKNNNNDIIQDDQVLPKTNDDDSGSSIYESCGEKDELDNNVEIDDYIEVEVDYLQDGYDFTMHMPHLLIDNNDNKEPPITLPYNLFHHSNSITKQHGIIYCQHNNIELNNDNVNYGVDQAKNYRDRFRETIKTILYKFWIENANKLDIKKENKTRINTSDDIINAIR